MQRWAPFLAVAVLLAIVGMLYGPGWWRSYTFSRDVEAMLAAARAGQIPGIVAAVDPAQQADANAVLTQYLPPDFASKIAKLSLGESTEQAGGGRTCIVTLRTQDGGDTGLWQGKLPWHWDGRHWRWDFQHSLAAPFSPSNDQQWVPLEELLPSARGL
jgi:hypothetical protein